MRDPEDVEPDPHLASHLAGLRDQSWRAGLAMLNFRSCVVTYTVNSYSPAPIPGVPRIRSPSGREPDSIASSSKVGLFNTSWAVTKVEKVTIINLFDTEGTLISAGYVTVVLEEEV